MLYTKKPVLTFSLWLKKKVKTGSSSSTRLRLILISKLVFHKNHKYYRQIANMTEPLVHDYRVIWKCNEWEHSLSLLSRLWPVSKIDMQWTDLEWSGLKLKHINDVLQFVKQTNKSKTSLRSNIPWVIIWTLYKQQKTIYKYILIRYKTIEV